MCVSVPLQLRLEEALDKRKIGGNYRSLSNRYNLTDFYSNDYLGLAESVELNDCIALSLSAEKGANKTSQLNGRLNGSAGSRLIAGNSPLAEKVEELLAAHYGSPECLLFNSGYDANLGFFSSVPSRFDTVIHDECIHASVIDGIRLGLAKRASFTHNDLESLEYQLSRAQGQIFVAVESLYSMDGDLAPLAELAVLALKHSAILIVDEAHAVGVFGEEGRGLSYEMGLAYPNTVIRLCTFGKALGVHGACLLVPPWMKHYLVNFARSFIYSTALAPHALFSIYHAHLMMRQLDEVRRRLFDNVRHFRLIFGERFLLPSDEDSPVQIVSVSGNSECTQKADCAFHAGFQVKAVLSPTVKEGSERLRICIHSYNSIFEIESLFKAIN